MTRYTIFEDGEEAGFVTDGGGDGYDYEYRGSNPVARRALEGARDHEVVDSEAGPGGSVAEKHAEAPPGEKLDRAVHALEFRRGLRLEEQ